MQNLQICDIREISISRSLVNSVLKTRVAVAAAVVVVNLVPYPVFRSLLRDSDVTIILNILGVWIWKVVVSLDILKAEIVRYAIIKISRPIYVERLGTQKDPTDRGSGVFWVCYGSTNPSDGSARILISARAKQFLPFFLELKSRPQAWHDI